MKTLSILFLLLISLSVSAQVNRFESEFIEADKEFNIKYKKEMKTIEEASKMSPNGVDIQPEVGKIIAQYCNTEMGRYRMQIFAEKLSEISFKNGVEFATRWIPVEEELPEVGEMVLTKMEKRHGDTWVQNYYSTATRLENQGEWQTVNWVDHSISFGHITHWRHIDIK